MKSGPEKAIKIYGVSMLLGEYRQKSASSVYMLQHLNVKWIE